MPYMTGLPAAIARRGLRVETISGWQTRGSYTFNPKGAVDHWTAGPRGTTGRPSLNIVTYGREGLPGPLCNIYLDRKGIAVVVAAGRANHAGRGGWRGLVGNSAVFGIEAESAGDGDWTAAQRLAYPKLNAALCDLGGFSAANVCGHNEWAPDRKIDIRDWPMSSMRNSVASILRGGTTREEESVRNLVFAKLKGGNSIWAGDGVFRRHVRNPTQHAEMMALVKLAGGDTTLREVSDLNSIGVEPPAPVVNNSTINQEVNLSEAQLQLIGAALSDKVAVKVADELKRRLET